MGAIPGALIGGVIGAAADAPICLVALPLCPVDGLVAIGLGALIGGAITGVPAAWGTYAVASH